MIKKSFWVAALVTLAPTALLAADPGAPTAGPHGEGAMFKRLDTNQDGVLSKEETAGAQRLAQSFDKLDADHDGMLTQDEMRAAGAARREEMKAQLAARFKEADKNADGLLSKEEAAAGMPRIAGNFDQLDTSKDGSVSLEEISAARHHMGPGGRPGKGQPGDTTQR